MVGGRRQLPCWDVFGSPTLHCGAIGWIGDAALVVQDNAWTGLCSRTQSCAVHSVFGQRLLPSQPGARSWLGLYVKESLNAAKQVVADALAKIRFLEKSLSAMWLHTQRVLTELNVSNAHADNASDGTARSVVRHTFIFRGLFFTCSQITGTNSFLWQCEMQSHGRSLGHNLYNAGLSLGEKSRTRCKVLQFYHP